MAPRIDEDHKFLNYTEFESLMNLAKDKLDEHFASRFMIVVAGATGLRFAELLGLTWDRVDFDKGIITVNRAWDYQDKKDFCSTKNTQSNRNVPIDPDTIEIMKKFKQNQFELLKKTEIHPPHEFVFYNVKDGLISNNAVNKKIKDLLRQLEIETPLTIHGLKHTHASVLIYKGINYGCLQTSWT